MNIKLYMMTGLLGLLLTSVNANAAFVDVTGSLNVGTGVLGPLTGAPVGGKPNNLTVTLSTASAAQVSQVFFSNNADGATGDLPNQSPTDVGTVLNTTFGVLSTSVGDGSLTGKFGTITSATPFNYLAIHLGQHELFFSFLNAITSFQIVDIAGKAAGLSNYRTYATPPNAVPVPAAVWLFGSALMGLVGVSRKKSKVIA